MAVTVTAGAALELGEPHVLFRFPPDPFTDAIAVLHTVGHRFRRLVHHGAQRDGRYADRGAADCGGELARGVEGAVGQLDKLQSLFLELLRLRLGSCK